MGRWCCRQPGASWAGATSRASSPPWLMSRSPSPIAASCLWPPAVVGSQKGANSPFWVQKGCIWHRKFMPAVVRPAQLCSQKGFCSITTSLTKKSKDLSPSASHVLAKALGTAFSVGVKLMFASPLMTDQYMRIDFSHQNIYFPTGHRVLKQMKACTRNRLPQFGSKQKTGIFFFILKPNFCG